MTEFALLNGLVGGLLIGLSALIMMLGIGRIAGISSIAVNAMWTKDPSNTPWRLAFLIGLPLGAMLVASMGFKTWSTLTFPAGWVATLAAGLFVGFGTTIGSGCTSGHGICGLARFSKRSFVATVTFIFTAAAAVFIVRHVI